MTKIDEKMLKPCPFCGKPARLVNYGFGISSCYITCSNEECDVVPSTRYYETEIEAMRVWNNRYEDNDILEHAKNGNVTKDICETLKRLEEKIEKVKAHIIGG